MLLKQGMLGHGVRFADGNGAGKLERVVFSLVERRKRYFRQPWAEVQDVFFVLLDYRRDHVGLGDACCWFTIRLVDGVVDLSENDGLHFVVANVRQRGPLHSNIFDQ